MPIGTQPGLAMHCEDGAAAPHPGGCAERSPSSSKAHESATINARRRALATGALCRGLAVAKRRRAQAAENAELVACFLRAARTLRLTSLQAAGYNQSHEG